MLRQGLVRAHVMLTLTALAGSLVITGVVLGLTGAGSMKLGLGVAATCALVLTPAVGHVVLKLVYELEASRQRISHLATMDELTACFNRRHFLELAGREWQRSRRHGLALSLILLDADNFKAVNDTHGHQCGDMLLREIALACGASLRASDVLARFGGEELIVLLPQTDLAGALTMAERMRARVAALQVAWQGHLLEPTISLGVAEMRRDMPTLEALIHQADVALYDAKRAGRNRVGPGPGPTPAPQPDWRTAN